MAIVAGAVAAAGSDGHSWLIGDFFPFTWKWMGFGHVPLKIHKLMKFWNETSNLEEEAGNNQIPTHFNQKE